jgi:hypothetical protein
MVVLQDAPRCQETMGGGISNVGDNLALHLIYAFVTFSGRSNSFRFNWEWGALVAKGSAFQPTTGVC